MNMIHQSNSDTVLTLESSAPNHCDSKKISIHQILRRWRSWLNLGKLWFLSGWLLLQQSFCLLSRHLSRWHSIGFQSGDIHPRRPWLTYTLHGFSDILHYINPMRRFPWHRHWFLISTALLPVWPNGADEREDIENQPPPQMEHGLRRSEDSMEIECAASDEDVPAAHSEGSEISTLNFDHSYCVPCIMYCEANDSQRIGVLLDKIELLKKGEQAQFPSPDGLFLNKYHRFICINHENSRYSNPTCYRELALCGRGGNGAVHKCQDVQSQYVMARKQISLQVFRKEEVEFLLTLSSELYTAGASAGIGMNRYFPAFHGLQMEDTHVNIWMEFVEYTWEHATSIAPAMKLDLLKQSLEALVYMHRLGILHLDMKPGNMGINLINDKPLLKILDFGTASSSTSEFQMAGKTPEYMSPEMFSQARHVKKQSDKADVWGLACSFIYLWSKNHVWQDLQCQKAEERLQICCEHIGRGDIHCVFSYVPEDLKKTWLCGLLQCMLQPDPTARCSAAEALTFLENRGDENQLQQLLIWREYCSKRKETFQSLRPYVETPAPCLAPRSNIETPAPYQAPMPCIDSPAPCQAPMPCIETPAPGQSQTPATGSQQTALLYMDLNALHAGVYNQMQQFINQSDVLRLVFCTQGSDITQDQINLLQILLQQQQVQQQTQNTELLQFLCQQQISQQQQQILLQQQVMNMPLPTQMHTSNVVQNSNAQFQAHAQHHVQLGAQASGQLQCHYPGVFPDVVLLNPPQPAGPTIMVDQHNQGTQSGLVNPGQAAANLPVPVINQSQAAENPSQYVMNLQSRGPAPCAPLPDLSALLPPDT